MTTVDNIRGTAETVQEFFRCFGNGDWTGVLAVVEDGVDWYVPGSPTVPWTGRRSGKAGVEAFLHTCAEEVAATNRFEVTNILTDGAHAVVLGAFTHVIGRTGKNFASEFALHVIVNDGRIRLYHMFENSAAAAEAFAA